MRLLVQWLIGIVAVLAAVMIVPEITIQGPEGVALAVTAAVLGLANLLVRPLIKLATMPITLATLGLFSLVVNGLVFLLAGWLSVRVFGLGVVIDGVIPAILGALIVGIVTTVLGWLLLRDGSPK